MATRSLKLGLFVAAAVVAVAMARPVAAQLRQPASGSPQIELRQPVQRLEAPAPGSSPVNPSMANPSPASPPVPGAPSAAAPQTGERPAPWRRALYKTITFQAVANATDLLVFETLIGGHALVLGGFVVANAATAAGLYYGFEYLWQRDGPSLDETTELTLAKKSLLFQAVNSGRIFLLGYSLGASAAAASVLAGTVFVTDTAVYFGNEYVWDILRPTVPDIAEVPLTRSSVPVSLN
jgi:hypothetical protein